MSGETVIGETAMRAEKTGGDIEVRLCRLSQLFTDFDPSPFREGNLTTEAEEYFLRRAKELPKNQPVRIVIHLPADEAAPLLAMKRSWSSRGWIGSRRQRTNVRGTASVRPAHRIGWADRFNESMAAAVFCRTPPIGSIPFAVYALGYTRTVTRRR